MDMQTLALFLAAIIAPYLTNLIKGNVISGRAAQWVFVVVAFVLAALAFVLTGGLPSPDTLVAKASEVCVVAGLIYRQIMKTDTPPTPAPGTGS